LLALATATLLEACGGIQIAPTPSLPRALVKKVPVKAGVVVGADMLAYKHQESRGGVSWEVALGQGHLKFATDTFGSLFDGAQVFRTLEEAKAAKDLAAIFEPRIEQYSFATARDTGSNYYAATIQYRIHVYNPAGERVDSFTLTGYGHGLAGRAMSGSTAPLIAATNSAMRDAAAKFMVQFPDQALAGQLSKGEPLLASAADVKNSNAFDVIEAVPVKE
jgi:hypothetical protein